MTYGNAQIPDPPKQGRSSKLVIALVFLCCAVLLLCCAGVISGMVGSKDAPGSPIVVPSATFATSAPAVVDPTTAPAKEAAAKPSPTVVMLSAGDYEVAGKTDVDALTIAPGTYKVGTYGHCYWERVSGFGGELDDIISNGNIDGKTIARVTVKKSDKGLSLQGDCLAVRAK